MKKLLLTIALVLSAGNLFAMVDTPFDLQMRQKREQRYYALKQKANRTPAEQDEFRSLAQDFDPRIQSLLPVDMRTSTNSFALIK